MSSARAVIGTFVVVFVVIVGTVSVGGLVVHDDTPRPSDVDTDHWDPDTVIPEEAPDGGEITMNSTTTGKTVVVHTGGSSAGGAGMGQPLPISDDGSGHTLSVGSLGGTNRGVGPLVSTLVENGHEVVFYDGGPSSRQTLRETLADADAFVTVGSATFTPTERESIGQFADAGGRTVIAASPGSTSDTAQIAATAGLYTETGYLYNLEENDNNHLGVYAEPTGDSPLTDGVDRVVLRGAAPVGTDDGETDLETIDGTTLSTTREAGTYAVAAHSGDMAVIGDSSFLEPENAYRVDNDVLVGNLADFLVTGETSDPVFNESPTTGNPNGPMPSQPVNGGQTSDSTAQP
ncbi:hypothetical protein [Natrinema salaciae]|uniref:GATase domain protein n=1 Tax=Natrinema salaciae TaxID=1186196 RepID=A0A1H9AHA1_9EURY|nr:hypothetical protein [Natrinema salaciae]SEP75975.1 hypothetical protein SAMN04489841_0449 [Natrinema salaciae]